MRGRSSEELLQLLLQHFQVDDGEMGGGREDWRRRGLMVMVMGDG
jgi:hypothetical protein